MAEWSLDRPRTLALLGLATVCWAFSFGAEAPTASLWLQEAGYSPTIIGLNTAVYYLGIAVTAGFVPILMRRWGRACMVVGMVASGATVAIFPWCNSLTAYFAARALNGAAAALSLVPLETILGEHSRPEKRARNFAFYIFCVGLGLAVGTSAGLQIYLLAPRLAFIVGGAVAAAAGLLFLWWLPPANPIVEEFTAVPVNFSRNVLSFGSSWSQGFLEGGMIGLLPVYLLGIGYSEADTGWLISGIILGVIASLLPLAWLADRMGNTRVLLACYAVAALGLACLPFCLSAVPLTFWMLLVAICSGAFYPLGLALLNEGVPVSGLARANSWFLAINCVGSLVGPAMTGCMMDWLGAGALFVVGQIGISGVVVLWAITRFLGRREKRGQVATVEVAAPGRKAA